MSLCLRCLVAVVVLTVVLGCTPIPQAAAPPASLTTLHGTPRVAFGSSRAIRIAAGWQHTCAVLATGSATCWGANYEGQFGDGTLQDRSTPVAVRGLSKGVVALAGGNDHTCALLTTGGVMCWGANDQGGLGDGTLQDRSTPVNVRGLSSGVVALAGGNDHTCALLTTGGVMCWGINYQGQLGDGTTEGRILPVAVRGLSNKVVALAAGGAHMCALLTTGGITCWGANTQGQLGDGTLQDRSTPVNVRGLSSGVVALAAGGAHTCALLTTGGVTCWGHNAEGQLGDGTSTSRRTPVAVHELSRGVAALSAGDDHTCALLTTGGVMCWGDNTFGELGDGTLQDRSTPVAVREVSRGIVDLAAGDDHTCAVLMSGGAMCWGSNSYGKLGHGVVDGRTATPVLVAGLMGPDPVFIPVITSSGTAALPPMW